MTSQTKTVALDKKVSITLTGVNSAFSLDNPIYAINWFDVKKEWLYNFYTLLAYPHVRAVKGKGIFKGKMIRKLEGSDQFNRDFLLIVGYTKADSFFRMISNKVFLLKSFIRIAAVRDFVFGFTYRFDKNENAAMTRNKYTGTNKYMVHIFQRNPSPDPSEFERIRNLATEDTTLFYGGLKAAYIGKTENNGELRNNPFFIDGILVWSAAQDDNLIAMQESDAYKKFKEEQEGNSLYFFKRLR